LNEPPIASSSPKSSIAEAWKRVVERAKRLLR
jgi:hypothetical protein